MSSAARLHSDDIEPDSLSNLEERIRKTVDMVTTLKAERDEALAMREEATIERDRTQQASSAALSENQLLRREIEELRRERNAVRARIEKLLGQMDSLAS